MAAKKSDETVTGRWPVAVYDKNGKRVAPGDPASVSATKAMEFDRRFGRLPEPKAETGQTVEKG